MYEYNIKLKKQLSQGEESCFLLKKVEIHAVSIHNPLNLRNKWLGKLEISLNKIWILQITYFKLHWNGQFTPLLLSRAN